LHSITFGDARPARSLADLASWLPAGLVAADLALVAVHLAMSLTDHRVAFLALDQERNLPTWYSSTKLFLLAQLLGLAGWLTPTTTRRQLLVLLAPAALFLYLSLDEAAWLHERIEQKTAAWVGGDDEGALGRAGYWPLLAGLLLGSIMVVLGTAFARLARPPAIAVRKAGLGAALFLLGAAGIDFLTPLVTDPVAHVLETAAEEGLELLGATLLVWAALDLLATRRGLEVTAPRSRP
jgi:hypothetical protein